MPHTHTIPPSAMSSRRYVGFDSQDMVARFGPLPPPVKKFNCGDCDGPEWCVCNASEPATGAYDVDEPPVEYGKPLGVVAAIARLCVVVFFLAVASLIGAVCGVAFLVWAGVKLWRSR